MTGRLRPTLAGLINLWDYTTQEFRFVDGRLVLRGPNGSGKTKALELLFPFLLDANLAPQRLDPFSGTGRTMRDNLLFRPGRDTVTGYAWMEFSSDDDGEGEPRTIVIGAGLRSNRSDPRVTSWYFITDKPHRDGWSLVDEDRRPLTQRQLGEVLGTKSVFTTASDYRRAVDAKLFGLGTERYESLVQLVLFLRRPQLAKDLDLRRLSDTLSQGLRPLDEDLLAEGARSFDDLEAVQRELDRLERACQAAESFMRAYRPYVRAVARGRTDSVLEARRRARKAVSEADSAREQRAEAGASHEAATSARATVRARIRRLGTEKDALQRSEAYRSIGQTEDLRARVGDASTELELSRQRQHDAVVRHDETAARLDSANSESSAADTEVDRHRTVLRKGAEVVAATSDDSLTLEGLNADDTAAHLDLVVNKRRADHEHVEVKCRVWEGARADLERAEAQLDQANTALTVAVTAVSDAEEAETSRRAQLFDDMAQWRGAFSAVVTSEDVELLAVVIDSGQPLALRSAAAELIAPRRRVIDDEVATLLPTIEAKREEIGELQQTRDLIAAAHDDEPPVPPGRIVDRSAATGAPLWRLVDFVPSLDRTSRARLEAALQACGLLDAWVNPDAKLSTDHDLYVTGGRSLGSPTLRDVLSVDAEAPASVDVSVVNDVLSSIALGGVLDTVATVDVSGRFSVGTIGGAATKPVAQYIGASTRAARRRQRVAALDATIASLTSELDSMVARLAELRSLSADHDRAVAQTPNGRELTDARSRVELAAAALLTRRQVAEEAQVRRQQLANVSGERHGELLRSAVERSLPSDRAGIDEFARSLRHFERATREFVASLRRAHAVHTRVTEFNSDLADQSDRCRSAATEFESRERALSERKHELATVEDSIGVAAEEVLASLRVVEAELVESRQAETEAEETQAQAQIVLRDADVQIEGASVEQRHAAHDEAEALTRLQVLARPELRAVIPIDLWQADAAPPADSGGDADPDDGDGDVTEQSWIDSLVGAIDTATAGVVGSTEQRSRYKSQVLNSFQQLEIDVGSSYHASLDDDDDIAMVWLTDDDGQSSAASFTDRIHARRDEHRSLLTAQERRVLEDTLLDGLCRQLHERTVDAAQQVASMNRALGDRATTSGKKVRLSWSVSPDLTEDRRRATKLLESDPTLLGPEAREEVREHLAGEIRAERASSPHASYRDVLSEVLDYRKWRVFKIYVSQDGEEHALTKKRYNTYSGGERAAVLHLPLFAAASAHYDSGRHDGPRLIALDEAFAGIDNRTTAELMALAVEFDLDLFLTGHDLRATFAEVPGVSIVHLTHHRESHSVSALHMRWDGHTLEHD